MNNTLFKDRRATGLLNRVREDVSHLRDDIGSLLTHTTRTTLPNGARELADQAKSQLAAGGAYAASRLRNLRSQPPRQSAGWIGGALIVGLLAYGAYALCRDHCQCSRRTNENEFDPEDDIPV
ncbi:MAG: hypothetical protein ABIS50_18290 [Luteolibacter sp.]|uniref:hypothetical protein n=1 Tax=Luteolibacter sp. TaxID=1962973 RepID=UPI0032643064